ncbi:MAG TPA: lytic transglycosylase domain-containing protein [Acetobacteraceae bacterium]|jgi:soluble lytic murein transglycosylase|nr:lytic transglycosylase domain-containing protein [Acetobacteraceae bacterium]
MRATIRPRYALVALFAATPAMAQSGDPIAAIRADRWSDAQLAAAAYADPVATKLVTYFRLLAPGAATADEITDFMAQNPDWPTQALLERRRQEAIAAEPDQSSALAQCERNRLTVPQAMLRCAEAWANAGDNARAAEEARNAWLAGITDAAAETAFLHRWSGAVRQEDQWARFQRLAWRDAAAAARQIPRLDPAHRAQAEARLALQRDAPNAETLLAALPAAVRNDPGMVIDRARWLRHADRAADALALWKRAGEAAQRDAPSDELAAFWTERNLLARRLLRDGNAAGAYALAANHGQITPEQMLDAEFLAGFIALRRLNDPAAATRHFTALVGLSKAAITQGRAYYWLGRATAAAGKDPRPDYERAAAWPTTFYGQLAALALGDDAVALGRRITSLHDPSYTREQVLAFTDREVVRAAAMLVAWNDPHRARAFLLRMDELAPDPAERSLTARLALRLGLPDTAVFVARRMGRDGLVLPEAGWPIAAEPPTEPVDPSVALGLIRQESSFDIGAVSPSGARGLMQLMPFTAQAVAKQVGVATSLVSLTNDPSHNMRLGTAYLQEMLDRFGNSLPLAVAAYNAGPHRVDEWLPENGDPRVGPIDMLDWIELIPINETRNYVQRVLENVVIYRARRGENTPTLLAQWTQ